VEVAGIEPAKGVALTCGVGQNPWSVGPHRTPTDPASDTRCHTIVTGSTAVHSGLALSTLPFLMVNLCGLARRRLLRPCFSYHRSS
jgi:hypothetical protein